MKLYWLILPALLFFSGCATSYRPIGNLESIGDAETSNSDLKLTVGIQPLGDNSRFKDKAEEEHITILKLALENISSEPFIINNGNIYLREADDEEPVSQLSPAEVADRMSLASGTYWLWGLLWMGYSENNNGETSGFWFPIGLPIGAINFFRAQSTNNSFEDEITERSFPSGEIASGDSREGMLFFNRRGGMKYNLIVDYSNGSGEKKEISIPYKF